VSAVARAPAAEEIAVDRDDGHQVVEVVGDAPREPADGLELVRLQEAALGALALLDLALELIVGVAQLAGALLDALLQLPAGAAELLLHPLAREEVGDGRPRHRPPHREPAAPAEDLDVPLDARRRRHDEAARVVAARAAEQLRRDELEPEGVLRPPRGVPRVHDAHRALPARPGAEPRVRLERVRVIVDEVEVVVRHGPRLGEDLDLRPPGVREVHRPRREPLQRLDEAHARAEALRVRLADGVRQIEEDVLGELVGLVLAARAVQLLDEREELDREGGRAHEDVAIAHDLEGAVLGIGALIAEEPGDGLLGLGEERLQLGRHAHGLRDPHGGRILHEAGRGRSPSGGRARLGLPAARPHGWRIWSTLGP